MAETNSVSNAAIAAKRKEAKKQNPFADPNYTYKKPKGSGQEIPSKPSSPSIETMRNFLTGAGGLTGAEVRALSSEQIKKMYRKKLKTMNKGGFPDLSGDGKVTQKDVLMGRGAMNRGGMYAAGGYVTDMMGKKKK
jgi:hypothetical protein